MAIAPIPMNDFFRQWTDTGLAVLDAVRRVGESGWYILGPEVARFEEALAVQVGRRFAVGCASGLDAIEISLRALGLKPGDKVLTTPLSAFATTLGILRAGGRPAFIDVDQSGLVDLDRARDVCSRHPSIRFFVPVHLFGHACDLEVLAALKSRFDLRGRALLPRLAGWTQRRQSIAERYLQGIRNPSVRTVPVPPGSRPAWHLFPVLVEPRSRDAFCKYLHDGGVRTGLHYPILITRQRALDDPSSFEILNELTRAEAFAASEVSLPIHAYLRDDEVETIVSRVNGWNP